MKIDESLFDREEFKAWLESQPAGAVIGIAQAACNCPLAQWLKAKGLYMVIGRDHAIVKDGSVAMLPRTASIVLPVWAQRFVFTVDVFAEQCKLANIRNSFQVKREKALEFLEVLAGMEAK